ncbi:outer membrane beta-barrel protein [Arvimicrobium flavum]|uniref:outer membrane beta-barrel protein n=1 Tax=Arvimicrobium flavum TaxID=3393320 RepID=UPI00237BAFD5|nr:outer membrane beta-barrel protein [Mesorhizobium shangrilense]
MRISCAAAVIALASNWNAAAQDRDQLRGQVPEDAVTGELLRLQQRENARRGSQPAAGAAPSAPQYQPASAGAIPDEVEGADATSAGSIFSDDDAEAGFLRTPPASGRTPSTAIRRASQTSATGRPTGQSAPSMATEEEEEPDTTSGIEPVARLEREGRLEMDEAPERVGAIEGLDRVAEDNPYAPLGLRLGSFNVYTSLEQGLTWTSNVNSSPDPEAALQSETTLRLRALSDWAEHSASLEAYGVLRESLDGPEVDDNEAGLNGALQLDLSDELRALGTVRYLMRPESASSPVVIEDAVSRPLRQTFETTAGIEKDIGKLRLAATGGLLYDAYGDADLANGEVLSQDERNSLLGTVTLRTGYEISPAVTPFVEVEAGRREYDTPVDTAGFERSATRLGARAGLALDLGEKLRGEVAAGWLQETPDDDRLETISSPTLDANLIWSPHRGTNVLLYGSTTVEGTTTPGETGSLLYTATLGVDREIRANLTGNALLGAQWRDYVGSDGRELTLMAEAGLTWWLNRNVGISGRARHEQVESNLEGRDTTTDSVFLGLRLQH